MLLVGIGVTVVTYLTASEHGGAYVIAGGPFIYGLVTIARGMFRLDANDKWTPIPEDQGVIPRFLLAIGGYRGFVAQRYLLIPGPKVSSTTKWSLLGLIVAFTLSSAILGTGIDHPSLTNPVFALNALLAVSITAVSVVGVLIYTRPALYVFAFGVLVLAAGIILNYLVTRRILFHYRLDEGIPRYMAILILILMAAGAALSGLALFFGFLRAFFTFFTTVPIGGVWIGTAALVCVLAVMSGFESDLREKILGSNAHIQVTREDGEMTEWRGIYDRILKIPGVVAATPYAQSEVVIASHNNGLNVIIKGIDPKTVGKVTKLVQDLEDKNALKDLEGKHEGDLDLRVPQSGSGSGSTVDPGPQGMPATGDPIDYSEPAPEPKSEPASGSGSATATASGSGADTDRITPYAPRGINPVIADTPPPIGSDFGGDAQDVVPSGDVVDPPPPGLAKSDAPPIDYSQPRKDAVDPQIHVLDLPTDSPSVVRRTESLPGVLVGRELVKQMHLYVGQETRLVSPLSDPSNPDATGTPIPFNRDYRIAGIFFTGMYEYDLKFIYVTLDSLQDFLDRGDAVDGIEVRIPSPDDTDAYVKKISAELGPTYRVVDWKELNRSLFSALKLEKIAMFLVLGIVILVASFSIVGNLIMVVVEKQREIALLKTLGASDPGIMQLFAIQGLLIGLVGTVLGVGTGLIACYVGKRIGVPLNPDVYYIDRLPVNVDPQSVGLTFAAGVVISILATFYPALLGARVRPATGMRH
jgi:lipoprotein-releasing system permease protein